MSYSYAINISPNRYLFSTRMLAINVLRFSLPCDMNMLSICYQYTIKLLLLCYQCAKHKIRSANYYRAVYMMWSKFSQFYRYAIDMLSICYQCVAVAVDDLAKCCRLAINVLRMCY